MRIFVGYTNPIEEQNTLGVAHRERVHLDLREIKKTHLHVVGSTRSGKSKWLERFCRELFKKGMGFTIIDPQGALAESLMSYFTYTLPSRPIIYLDPSRNDYLIPFNPLFSESDHVSARVSRFVESVLKVWGVSSIDATPRLGRWLTCVCNLFATGEFGLSEVNYLLTWANHDMRVYAAKVLKNNPVVQNEWLQLLSYKTSQLFDNQIESTRNRLFRFAEPLQIRRIMSLNENKLNLRKAFEKGTIVIANLQENRDFSEENSRLIGTLIINELWAAARSRKTKPDKPYFLFIDEIQQFLTPDIKQILDRGAGKGLHLGAFHQHLTQFRSQDPRTFESIRTNAKIKLVFGGLTKTDNLLMVDEMFGKIIYDYKERRFVSKNYCLDDKGSLADMLKEQPQRHHVIKQPGYEALPVYTPLVREYKVSPKREDRLILDRYIKPYGFSVDHIDHQLKQRLEKIKENAKKAVSGEEKRKPSPEEIGPDSFRIRKKSRKKS